MSLEVPYRGGCLCGRLRYESAAPARAVYCCHCMDCQRRTGSAFGITVAVPVDAFRRVEGEACSWASSRLSGNTILFWSCAVCGTRCWAEPSVNPRIVVILGGTIDDAASLEPTAHIHTATRQRWIEIPDGVYASEGEPDWRQVF